MAFIDKLKKIFGIGGDDREILDDEPAALQHPAAMHPQSRPSVNPDAPLQASPQMVQLIFDGVVAEINKSLPEYLGSAVDPDKQKKFLYDALDQSVKDYLSGLEAQAAEKCRLQWQKEREGLKQETDALKQKAKDLETKRSELNEKQLSAERQKRALQERVHDLEKKVLTLEAEKEQYDIENKSLLNKAKVAAVYEKELEELQQQLKLCQSGDAPAADTASADEVKRLSAEIEQLKAENARLSDSCRTAKMKDEMGGAMLNDLQKKASEAIQASKSSEQKVAVLEARLTEREAHISALEQEIASKDARIQEDSEAVGALEGIMEQLGQFEEVKSKLNDKIAKLRSQLAEARKENESLKTTIKNNLYIQAQQEKAMQDEIDNLRTVSVDRADRPAQENRAAEIPYPSLFGDDGDKPAPTASDARTDDLIADTGWIK